MKIIAALVLLLCVPSYAQQMLSPKLTQFLLDHPAASSTLSNVLWEAQRMRPVHIYYFYASGLSHLPTMHRYLDGSSVVGIFVRENQSPCDECIDILFEALNLKGEKRFKELWDQVDSGTISRKDYAREMRRAEFQAVLATKKLISNFKLNEKEATESLNFKSFAETPTKFEDFLVYNDKLSQGQVEKYYEEQYDAIRRTSRP